MYDGKEVKDHLGRKFRSVEEMCRVYGIDSTLYNRRRNMGWSIKESLTEQIRKEPTRNKSVEDHLGNKYASVVDMCKAYKISYNNFCNRYKQLKWSLEDSLTKPLSKGIKVKDHLGNEYKNIETMCLHYKIDGAVYRYRVNKGWDIEKILTTPQVRRKRKEELDKGTKEVVDHLGNIFSCKRKMCERYNIAEDVFDYRRKVGLTLKEALTNPIRW